MFKLTPEQQLLLVQIMAQFDMAKERAVFLLR